MPPKCSLCGNNLNIDGYCTNHLCAAAERTKAASQDNLEWRATIDRDTGYLGISYRGDLLATVRSKDHWNIEFHGDFPTSLKRMVFAFVEFYSS